MSKYSILIEAKLDTKASEDEISKGLTELSGSEKVKIELQNVRISESSLNSLKTQIEKYLGGINIGVNAVPSGATQTLPQQTSVSPMSVTPSTRTAGKPEAQLEAEFLSIVNELKAQGLELSKQSIKFAYDENGEIGKLTSATVEFNNQLGQSITKNYQMVESIEKEGEEEEVVYNWVLKTGQAIENNAKLANSYTQEVKKQTAGMEQMANAQKQIDAASKTIGTTRLDSSSAQVQELSNAVKNYQNILNEVKSRGPIVSAEDNQLLAQAEIRLNEANNALKKEVEIQKQISDALVKNSELDRKRNEGIKQQIEDATKLADITEKSLKGKSGEAVDTARQSIVNLRKATQDLSDAQGKDNIVISQAEDNLKKMTNATENASAAVKAGGKNLQSWGTEIGVAIKRSIEWAGAMTLLYGTLRQVQAGVQYIKDLNKELVNIQLVTGASTDDVSKMAAGFNNLARELGSTTREVANGSLEWFRQGKTAQETTILLRDSTMMAKLANLDAAQSTEYMTSIMNGFQMQAEDMSKVLDTLVNLDNNYATSVGEIADAMQRSSNSAKQSGVSLETLASYITILSSTTRKSAESIGESFP